MLSIRGEGKLPEQHHCGIMSTDHDWTGQAPTDRVTDCSAHAMLMYQRQTVSADVPIGRFGIAVALFVARTKLLYVGPG